jgi:hypothetical protein
MTTTIRVVPHISVVLKAIHDSIAILHLVGSYAGNVAGRSRLHAAAMALDAVSSLADAPVFQ